MNKAVLCGGPQGLIVTVVEEDRDRSEIIRSLSSVYLGEGELGLLGAVAVEVDVPAEVEGGGEDHDPGVVHPLAVLPLPGGQVRQTSLLTNKDDIYHVLLNIFRQVPEMVADLSHGSVHCRDQSPLTSSLSAR